MSTTATEPLTPRQREIHRWILGYQAKQGLAPSFRNVMAEFGLKSTNAVKCHFDAMVKKGCMRRVGHGISRAWIAVDPDARRCECCGQPISDDPFGSQS